MRCLLACFEYKKKTKLKTAEPCLENHNNTSQIWSHQLVSQTQYKINSFLRKPFTSNNYFCSYFASFIINHVRMWKLVLLILSTLQDAAAELSTNNFPIESKTISIFERNWWWNRMEYLIMFSPKLLKFSFCQIDFQLFSSKLCGFWGFLLKAFAQDSRRISLSS